MLLCSFQVPFFLADLSLLSKTMSRSMAKRRTMKVMEMLSIRMEMEEKMPWWWPWLWLEESE
jgi:Na+/pantothenate symporter